VKDKLDRKLFRAVFRSGNVKTKDPSSSCVKCFNNFMNLSTSKWDSELKKGRMPGKKKRRKVVKDFEDTCRKSCRQTKPTKKKLGQFCKNKN
jgi:hypothetical protein